MFVDDIIIQAKDWTVFSCQCDILKRAAILDSSQEDAVKVSCCILSVARILHIVLTGQNNSAWCIGEPSGKLVVV